MTVVTEVAEPKYRTSWMTPSQCMDYYHLPYKIREIQIHWWDDPAKKSTHTSVLSYIQNKKEGSVNYIVSANRVTLMVIEDNCAITTQNGNPHGVKLECSPYGTDADYRTIAVLIADIWKRRGKLPLVPHKKYWNTICPGTLDLARMEREANEIYKGEDMTKEQAQAVSKWIRLLQHMSEKDAASYAKSDVPYLMEKPENLGKFLEDAYKSKEWQDANYKAVNYKKDVEAAKAQAAQGMPKLKKVTIYVAEDESM